MTPDRVRGINRADTDTLLLGLVRFVARQSTLYLGLQCLVEDNPNRKIL